MEQGFERALEKFLHLGYFEYAADSEAMRNTGKITWDLSTTPPNSDILGLVKENLSSEIKHFDYEFSRDTKIHKYLSRILKCNEKDITLTAGAEEGLRVISQVLIDSETNVLITQPNFSRVNFYPKVFGAKNISEISFVDQPKEKYSKLLNSKLKERRYEICYICNPNNPTGNFVSIEELLTVIDKKPHTFFVLDMALFNFVLTKISLAQILQRRNIAMIFSFSKVFGVPGIRVGFIVTSNRELNLALRNIISPFHLSSVSMNIVSVLFSKLTTVKKFLKKERNLIQHNYDLLQNICRRNKNIRVLGEPSYNVVLVGNQDSEVKLFKFLVDKGILTVDLANLEGMIGMNAVRIVLTKKRLDFLSDLLNNY